MSDIGEPMLTQHFAWIHRRWPAATIEREADGAHTITVPGVPVVGYGYDVDEVTVSFTVSPGFPFACPADFWTGRVRHVHGGHPRHTQDTIDGRLHWFHRVTHWDPRRDSLINYMGSILRRLRVGAQPIGNVA